MPGYVTTICAVTALGGVQLIVLGVIGEYLGRIYAETKQRPLFLLKESSGNEAVTAVLGREHEALHELEVQSTERSEPA